MPEPEPNPGLSGAEPVDVDQLVESLQRELRYGGMPPDSAESSTARRAALRQMAERFRAVSAERPFQPRTGPLAAPATFTKKVLRKLMRWYVEPLAAEQRNFNDAILRLVDALNEELDRSAETNERLARKLEELEGRQ
jgi:O-antigen chain-terminating methyltransferase